MMIRDILLIFPLFFFLSCGSNLQQEQESASEDMTQFVEDEKFKAAHDTPETIDFEGKGKTITFKTPDDGEASAYALLHEEATDKFLLVIHEWWGLNDQIKREAERLFSQLDKVNVIALDMYDGKVTDKRDEAGKLMQGMQLTRGEAIVKGAIAYAGEDTKIATIGWCFGGGWSLRSSIIAEDQGVGCVIYYGMPVKEKEALEPLKADVLGIFAQQDGFITPEVAENFEQLAKSAGKSVEIHQFDANHAFANPSSQAYVEKAAQEANALALAFLKERL